MLAEDVTQLAPLLVVAAALTRSDGHVLVQLRPMNKHHGGLWEFPGGKVEPGETPEAALARELAEELGIIIAPGDLQPLAFSSVARTGRPLVLLLYRAFDWDGDPRAIEAVAIRWLSPARLGNLPMPPADLPLIAALNEDGQRSKARDAHVQDNRADR